MAELYKFKDKTKSPEDRVAPIEAQKLDDNFKMVWIELSDSLKSFLKITENTGARPKLDFVTQPPSAAALALFEAGRFREWRTITVCPS